MQYYQINPLVWRDRQTEYGLRHAYFEVKGVCKTHFVGLDHNVWAWHWVGESGPAGRRKVFSTLEHAKAAVEAFHKKELEQFLRPANFRSTIMPT